MRTEKKCKGTGKAIGHGCGDMVPQAIGNKPNRKYGLGISCGCYAKWLYGTEEGLQVVEDHQIRAKNSNERKAKKDWNERKDKMKVTTHRKENKRNLQIEINRLAKMIDKKFGYDTCIDCGKPFTEDRDRDGGHCHSVGSNETIRYNLHNIHGQKSLSCNSNGTGGGKQHEYLRGLEQRYGKEYRELVEFTIVRRYKYNGLTDQDYADKLKIVRAIIRNFDTYRMQDAIQAREMFNKIIGIYR